jgi:hypothetical protein
MSKITPRQRCDSLDDGFVVVISFVLRSASTSP